jgi:hypothetical protein
VAGRTTRAEEALAGGDLAQLRCVGVVVHHATLHLVVVEPGPDLGREDVRVLERRTLHPTTGLLVPDDQAQVVIVRVIALDLIDVETELLAEQGDVFVVAREEGPTVGDLVPLGVVLQHRRRVVLGIDGDRVEVAVTTHTIAQDSLDLGESRRLEGARIGAAGVDEIDHHHLARDHVVEEADRGAARGAGSDRARSPHLVASRRVRSTTSRTPRSSEGQ